MPSKIINYCKNGDLEGLSHCLKSVSELGSGPNDPDIWGRRPLYYAVRNRNITAIRMLVEHGADITLTNRISDSEEDLMVTGFKTASMVCIRFLTELYDRAYIGQNIATYIPFLFRGGPELLEIFIHAFKLQSLKSYESVFCRNGKIAHYKMLISCNVCFDLQTALKYTIVYGRYAVFQFLLTLVRYDEQLDHIYRGPYGSQQTLMSLCAINGYYKGLRCLVKYGANINVQSVNERGETRNCLMAAVDNNRYQQLCDRQRVMIQKCVYYLSTLYPINQQNSRGQTALMFAQRADNTELVEILLELGADVNIRDMDQMVYNSGLKVSQSLGS